jgi:hypothetical protein
LDFLSSVDNPAAEQLRARATVHVVPMLNPDGVVLGNYRCSAFGEDLNRCWQFPDPARHSSIAAIQDMLVAISTNPETDLQLYIDLHAHSTLPGAFIYGNLPRAADACGEWDHWRFPRLLASFASDFSLERTCFNNDSVKAGTSRRTVADLLGMRTHCYTLEVSFGCYDASVRDTAAPATSEGERVYVPYTDASYIQLGHNLGRALSAFFCMPQDQGLVNNDLG